MNVLHKWKTAAEQVLRENAQLRDNLSTLALELAVLEQRVAKLETREATDGAGRAGTTRGNRRRA